MAGTYPQGRFRPRLPLEYPEYPRVPLEYPSSIPEFPSSTRRVPFEYLPRRFLPRFGRFLILLCFEGSNPRCGF
jgi:hypothetical protein